MNKVFYLLIVAKILFFSSSSMSAEIDSYSGTDEFIWSASSVINIDVNSRLKLAVKNINQLHISCSPGVEERELIYEYIQDALMENVSSYYVGHFIAEYFNEMIPANAKIIVPFEESIYKEMNYFDGVSLRLKGTLGIIKVNGNFHMFGANYIGADKLGHFFVEGYSFFEKAYLEEGGSIQKAIQWGQDTESGKYGFITTGVYSYADLVANFNGMRFWNQILYLQKDPLNEWDYYHKKPFLTCGKNKWKLSKKFDFDEYTDAAWDEKINCNDYRNEDIKEKIKNGFKLAQHADHWDAFCPAIQSRCNDSHKKYKEFSKDLISPLCVGE